MHAGINVFLLGGKVIQFSQFSYFHRKPSFIHLLASVGFYVVIWTAWCGLVYELCHESWGSWSSPQFITYIHSLQFVFYHDYKVFLHSSPKVTYLSKVFCSGKPGSGSVTPGHAHYWDCSWKHLAKDPIQWDGVSSKLFSGAWHGVTDPDTGSPEFSTLEKVPISFFWWIKSVWKMSYSFGYRQW